MIIFKLNQEINWGFPGGSAGKESACNPGDLTLDNPLIFPNLDFVICKQSVEFDQPPLKVQCFHEYINREFHYAVNQI